MSNEKKATDLVFIWSNKRQAYWRENSQGYTTDITDAGLFLRYEAEDIVAGSLTSEIHEIPSPSGEDKPEIILGNRHSRMGSMEDEITTHHDGVHIASPVASIPSFPAPPEMTAEEFKKRAAKDIHDVMCNARRYVSESYIEELFDKAANLRAAEAVKGFAKEYGKKYEERYLAEAIRVIQHAESYITNKLK